MPARAFSMHMMCVSGNIPVEGCMSPVTVHWVQTYWLALNTSPLMGKEPRVMAVILWTLHFAVCACTENKNCNLLSALKYYRANAARLSVWKVNLWLLVERKCYPYVAGADVVKVLLFDTCNLQVYICRVAWALVDENEQCVHMLIWQWYGCDSMCVWEPKRIVYPTSSSPLSFQLFYYQMQTKTVLLIISWSINYLCKLF